MKSVIKKAEVWGDNSPAEWVVVKPYEWSNKQPARVWMLLDFATITLRSEAAFKGDRLTTPPRQGDAYPTCFRRMAREKISTLGLKAKVSKICKS